MLLLLAPLLASTPADALGAWHTRYAILGTTGTFDFLRTGSGCLVGVPRDGGGTVLRCGGSPVPDPGQAPPPDLDQVLARAAADQRHGWAAAREPTWIGAWKEVTLVEYVPTPTEGVIGGLAVQGAAAWEGATGLYGWKKVRAPSLAEARWIDWRPPAHLDGTFLTLGARSDPRYAEPARALDAAIRATVDRYLAGEALPTGPAEVPGGPLVPLPPTRLAAEVVVFMQTPLAESLGLPWDFRSINAPVALLDDVLRYEYPLSGSNATLLVLLSRWGAEFELGAPGPPCDPWTTSPCHRPPGTAVRARGSHLIPVRHEGRTAAIDGPIRVEGVSSDGPLGTPHDVEARLWIISTQIEPAVTAWRGAEPLIVIAPPRPRPPSRFADHAPPPPVFDFPAPASAALTGQDGRWRVDARLSVFPLRLQVGPEEPVTLESSAFYGDVPPLPEDEAPGPAEVVDARGWKEWTWRFAGERPRWVRLRWRTGDHLLATAILPV